MEPETWVAITASLIALAALYFTGMSTAALSCYFVGRDLDVCAVGQAQVRFSGGPASSAPAAGRRRAVSWSPDLADLPSRRSASVGRGCGWRCWALASADAYGRGRSRGAVGWAASVARLGAVVGRPVGRARSLGEGRRRRQAGRLGERLIRNPAVRSAPT
jgi:hypothetical protein